MTATDPSPATSTSPLLALHPRRVESGILVLVGVVVAVAYGLATWNQRALRTSDPSCWMLGWGSSYS